MTPAESLKAKLPGADFLPVRHPDDPRIICGHAATIGAAEITMEPNGREVDWAIVAGRGGRAPSPESAALAAATAVDELIASLQRARGRTCTAEAPCGGRAENRGLIDICDGTRIVDQRTRGWFTAKTCPWCGGRLA